MILQVIEPEEKKIRYFSIREEHQDLVKGIDGKAFQSDDTSIDPFIEAMGGELKFMEDVSIGHEVKDGFEINSADLVTFWYD